MTKLVVYTFYYSLIISILQNGKFTKGIILNHFFAMNNFVHFDNFTLFRRVNLPYIITTFFFIRVCGALVLYNNFTLFRSVDFSSWSQVQLEFSTSRGNCLLLYSDAGPGCSFQGICHIIHFKLLG